MQLAISSIFFGGCLVELHNEGYTTAVFYAALLGTGVCLHEIMRKLLIQRAFYSSRLRSS